MSGKNGRRFVNCPEDIFSREIFGQAFPAEVFEDVIFPEGADVTGFPAEYAPTQTRSAPPAPQPVRKAHKPKKKKSKTKSPMESKPVTAASPAPAAQPVASGKLRIDKRQMIIYDALLHPKFDE